MKSSAATEPSVTSQRRTGTVTVSVTVVVRVTPPPVPTIVKVYVPGAIRAELAIVSVEVNVGLPVLGLKEYWAPVGSPLTVSVTGCVTPLTDVSTKL